MQINVAQLMKESTGATRTLEVDDSLRLDTATDCRIRGQAELLRTKTGVLVRGTFVGSTRLTCSRCLSPFEHPLAFEIEEEFLPTVEVSTGVAIPLDEDSAPFTIDEHHILDLGEPLRQYGLLAMPMKPLCRHDCAGLCPHCGVNLNQASCDCPPASEGLPPSEVEKLNSIRKSR